MTKTSLKEEFIEFYNDDSQRPDEIADFWLAKFSELEREVEGMKKTMKVTHGTCCTCQNCGYPNDNDCECPRNEVLIEVLQLIKERVG